VQPLGSSQHFMEPEGSLPSSQELSTCTYRRSNTELQNIRDTKCESYCLFHLSTDQQVTAFNLWHCDISL
jgi:hypothetical protein